MSSFFVDNGAARANLISMSMWSPGTTHAELIKRLWKVMREKSIFLWTSRVPSASNIADKPSRFEFAQLEQSGFIRSQMAVTANSLSHVHVFKVGMRRTWGYLVFDVNTRRSCLALRYVCKPCVSTCLNLKDRWHSRIGKEEAGTDREAQYMHVLIVSSGLTRNSLLLATCVFV